MVIKMLTMLLPAVCERVMTKGQVPVNISIHFSLSVLVIASLALSSCSSTELFDTWRDPSYVGGPLKKVLVVAVRKNQPTRRAWEDGLADALAGHGVDVTKSYVLFSSATPPDTAFINSVTREQGYDGIILIGRTSTQTTESVTAEYNITPPDFSPQEWGGWVYAYYNREYYPGYPIVDEVVKDEIKVWTTQGEARMIWSGVGEFQDNDTDEDMSDEIIHLIVPELVKQGVIAEGH